MEKVLGVGTEKGGFILRHGGDGWSVSGPLFTGWKVTAWGRTPSGGYLCALGSNWFGASIHRSSDLVEWEQVESGPDHHRELEQFWTFHTAGSRIYTGVAKAGVFSSDDEGLTWSPMADLNHYPGSDDWTPGLGGLAAHRIVTSGDRLWIAISAVGVFRSDGGELVRADAGVTPAVDETEPGGPGYCVHSIVAASPDRLWRQDHSGVYRTDDGGDQWDRIESGLPSSFGFPIVRDRASGRIFVVPLQSDENRLPVEGRFAAYLSDDDGDSWRIAGSGWPDEPTFTAVLRGAADADGEGSIYLGTTGGNVWATHDAGDHWYALPFTGPRILSVKVLD